MQDDASTATLPPTAEASTPGGNEPVPPAPRRLLLGALAGLSVFGLALAVTFGILWARAGRVAPQEVTKALSESRPEAARVATAVATLLMNYDAANLDEVASDLLELSTGNFREDYENVLSGGLGDALEKAAASSRGQILDGPDVYFESSDEAVALMRLSQTTQSADSPQGQSFVYVMKITLVETESAGWKADRVEILSQERS